MSYRKPSTLRNFHYMYKWKRFEKLHLHQTNKQNTVVQYIMCHWQMFIANGYIFRYLFDQYQWLRPSISFLSQDIDVNMLNHVEKITWLKKVKILIYVSQIIDTHTSLNWPGSLVTWQVPRSGCLLPI